MPVKGAGRPLPLPGLLSAIHIPDPHSPGMAGLASYLARRHARVTVSSAPLDARPDLRRKLERCGVHLQATTPGGIPLIWGGDNTAIQDILDHAVGRGLPVLGYDRAVELLAGTAPVTVAVAGSHSTTMAAAALTCALARRDPGWILAEAPKGDSVGYDGDGEVLVADLCPDSSGHETSPPGWRFRTLGEGLRPTVTLITAADAAPPCWWNHPEALDRMEALARRSETVVVWAAQPGCQELADRLRRHRPGPRVVTVGRGTDTDVQVLRTFWTGEDHRVTVQADGERHTFTVPVPGTNNAMAVAAAWAAGWALGVPGTELADGLGAFAGVERSLTRLGSAGGIDVVESRAVHPGEIAADLQGARMLTEGAVVAVYEPSGHLRSNALAGPIADALSAADRTVLLPVHSTFPRHRNRADGGEAILNAGSTDTVIRHEPGLHQAGADALVASLVQRGDLILTIGSHLARQIGPSLLAVLDQP
ncbi:glutamate ligase domain-containing protein [Kitasatospora sp. NPDC096204]|uniref:glutamate ligase domain-containing protein n=1 Tax=Kitasatospora sp. NPDC096204 TaxID=3364094 RepID=UPI00380EFE0E